MKRILEQRKSQAALEFLMTYGWAILVVLVAVGALAYFGVLSPEKFLPAKCTLPAGIACLDHRASSTTNQIQIVLQNSLGYDLTGVIVQIGGCGIATPSSGDNELTNGEKDTFTSVPCNPVLTGGSKFNKGFGITYTITETTLTHIANGTITTRVE